MTAPRLAASVLVTRGSGLDMEVFLVRRNPALRFMGGYWAFPGGTVTAEDYIQENKDGDLVFVRCALRELFEETGILVQDIGSDITPAQRLHIRNQLLTDSATGDWVALLDHASEAVNDLAPVCNLITPPFAPVRYDTRFYHYALAGDTQPDVITGELIDSGFFKPAAAVNSWLQGNIDIAPPVIFLLRLMKDLEFAEFVQAAGKLSEEFRSKNILVPIHFVPGIFMAPLQTPTLPPATTTNTLIIGSDSLYLVEPATPHQHEQLRLFAKMDELLAAGKRFAAILLTHHHTDHIGAVTAVSRRYNLPVRAHPLTYQRLPDGYIRGEPLHDGDRIELGTSPDGLPDWHLDVIHTPGHAVDHLCYLESRYHAAIVGDMLSTISTILIDPPEGHMRTYLNSLERLLEYPLRTVFPAHGPVHLDGRKLIRKFLDHRHEREQKLIAALTAIEQTVEELLPGVYDDVTPASYPVAARSLLAGLIKLAEDGICEQREHGWRLTSR